jgi:hypothetical protein
MGFDGFETGSLNKTIWNRSGMILDGLGWVLTDLGLFGTGSDGFFE